jgi:GNAT superfamily N-acetyltransferase
MKFSELRNKVARNLRDPPFIILQTLFSKLPSNSVGVIGFYLLQFGNASPQPNLPSRGRGAVRAATPEDAYEMGQLENKHELVLRRFAEKENAVVGVVDGKIVAYMWLSDKPFHIEDRYSYKINIPPNAVYAYDAYILPEYRISGLWTRLMLYAAGLMQKLDRDQLIALIDYQNRHSFNTHMRFGFLPFRNVYGIQLFRKTIFIEKAYAGTDVLRQPDDTTHRREVRPPRGFT